ncbi:hypothetical protein AAE478_009451 [Parahypoxylon ruwenzoriense]
MAQNSKSAAEFLGSPDPSPSQIFGETGRSRIQRRLVKIASDQQELLELPGCWAEILSRSPKGFLNVPPHVVKNLKKCHAQQLQAAQSDEPPPSADTPASVGNEDEHAASQLPRAAQSEQNAGDGDDGFPLCSWTPSPAQNSQSTENGDSETDEQQFVTQAPLESPPKPTAPLSAKWQGFNDFPSSVPEQEVELEVQIPTTINDSIPLARKPTTKIVTTPPSAQVQIVPCTFEQSDRSPAQSKQRPEQNPKQRAYNSVPAFYNPPKNKSAPTHLNYDVPRPRSSNADIRADIQEGIQSSISTGHTSPSIIPSTMQHEVPRKGLPAGHVNEAQVSSDETQVNHEDIDNQGPPQIHRHSPQYKPSSPHLRSSPPAPSIPHPSPLTISQPDSTSQAPFIRFASTYPSYNGTINDFVTACMYIQLQQRRIRTSLYDDFIRAWYEGYVVYVKECDDSDPPTKALNAIDWYNEIDDDPSFTSRVVTRRNLESTLNFYPDELRSARNLLGLSPRQTPEATAAGTTRLARDPNPAFSNSFITMDLDSAESLDILEPDASRNSFPGSASLEPTPNIPQQQSGRILSVHKSMDEIEARMRPVKPKGFTRSLSEAIAHKRNASDDISNAPSKRISVNSLPRSDFGSSISVESRHPKSTAQSPTAPSSSIPKKKNHADGAKRSERFAKYLKKRKQWEKDSITSSAPVNNTPTSAQRE